jgi:Cu/Ag efflux pump CusA
VRFDILVGSFLVIVILFLFLFNFRTAFISATAIPLSLLTAISVLSYFNLGLNIMVLSGLAIALGEVVDDAIIDSEIFLGDSRKISEVKHHYLLDL